MLLNGLQTKPAFVAISHTALQSVKAKKVHFSLPSSPSCPHEHDLVVTAIRDQQYVDDFDADLHGGSKWWDSIELAHFQCVVRHEARSNPLWAEIVMDTYEKSAGRIASFNKNELRLIGVLQNLKVDPALLALWSGRDKSETTYGCHRGLEKRHIGKKSACSYRTMVMASQGKLNQEQLRRKCLNHSRQDRIFARMLGIADAALIGFRDDDIMIVISSRCSFRSPEPTSAESDDHVLEGKAKIHWLSPSVPKMALISRLGGSRRSVLHTDALS